ncbi:hypothetical protein N8I77_008426 [Diaporthe amygdali]|uniref:Carboxylic ester hydrolase n=1 Tax=Phomopsis amygdali TaxID=1214568 RepID=A0AAD9SEA4_PHOAM|nr:hypothetical protein N8I77_008426 [Diaporthe amygdali]
MSNSSLASLCSSGNIPSPTLFGAEIISLSSNLVSNYSTYVPETYNYNHPSINVENVDYCNITVTYTHLGQIDKINVEAWLPLEWNERLMAVGGGGLVADRFVLSYFFMSGAIGQGYAAVTTDAGTSTFPTAGMTEFLLGPGNMDGNAIQNFGSRASNDESIIAKNLVASFYGRKPKYSYWSAYDGIVASAPAINCSDTGSRMQISHGAALVANATWTGPISADGTRLWYGMEKGAPLDIANTECSSNGTCAGMVGNAGEGWLAYRAVKDPSFDSSNLTLDAYSWLMHTSETEWKSLWSTNEPDLYAYRNIGGKILTYHGLADQNIPPKGTRDYYESVAKVLPEVNDFFRVFEVPGLEHCSGGSGGQPTTIFDQMRAWVENGTVPETLPISFTSAKNETYHRIVCPLPLKTTFNATCGDGTKAECFHCAKE